MTRSSLTRRLVRSLFVAVAVAAGVYLLLPQLAGLEATGEAIAHASWWLPATVVGLEAASLAAYGELLLVLLHHAGAHPGRAFTQRAVLVGNAVGRALPGGTTTAFAVVLAAFRRRDVDLVAAGTSQWGAGTLSSATLAGLLPIGVVVGFLGGHVGRIALSAVLAAGGAAAVVAAFPVAMRDPDTLAARVEGLVAVVARGPLRGRLDPAAIGDGVRRGALTIRDLAADRRVLRVAVGWAALNWLLDIGVVITLALTVGRGTPVSAVLLAYVIAQVVAAVPLTPGGVGVVETAMVGTLVAAGAPGAAATATVLGWRLVAHWIPLPVGLALLPSLRGGALGSGRGRSRRRRNPVSADRPPTGRST